MAQKILEKILEPSKILVGSSFLLKIKAVRYLSYEDIKIKSYNDIKKYTYGEVKGE